MRFRFFTIPAFDPDAAQDALNAFCAQHRIVASSACCAAGRGTTTAKLPRCQPQRTGQATATTTLASALPQLKSRRLRL
jgi:hypothetical protein